MYAEGHMNASNQLFNPQKISTVLAIIMLAVISAAAQMAPTRTWEQLKEETQRRVDKNLGPVGGLKSEDAREATSNIHSLDRDEWAAGWSAIAERYDNHAKSEEAAKNNDAARDDYFGDFRYYKVARWAVPNSLGKQKAYQNALAAFRSYGRFLDPPVEILHIPFEGKEIAGYIRLPKDVRPAPVVFMINGTDSRKEDEVQGRDAMFRSGIGVVAVDMPGTGESPVKADVGCKRRKRQPGAHFRPLYADAIGRLGQMVVGQSQWRTHWALAGVAQFQDRRGSHHGLGKGSARTGVRK